MACPPVLQCCVLQLAIGCLALLIGSCTVQPDGAGVTNRNDNSSPTRDDSSSPDASAPKRFWFGIEYAVTGLSEIYSGTGAITAKPMPALMEWGRLQPSEGDPIQWNEPDDLIAEYQQAGFENMQLLTDAESPWASRDTSLLPEDIRPKEEFEDDYVEFIRAIVERYDGDGVDDMPGLLYPIHMWGVEREFTEFTPGSGANYVELLALTAPVIREADPEAEIMLNGLLMWDIFEGNPDDDEVAARLADPPFGQRKDITDVSVLLDAHEYYDVIDFHSLVSYTEIPACLRWLRQEMEARGIERPVYIGDAFPSSPLMGFGVESCAEESFLAVNFLPTTSETRCEVATLIAYLRGPNSADHEAAHQWLERDVAINLIRRFVVAAGEGAIGVNVGNLEDWVLTLGAGTSQFMGLIDTSLEVDFANMSMIERVPGDVRPGFYAVALVVEHLQDFHEVTRLDVGENIWAYEFSFPDRSVTVTWYDDRQFHGLHVAPPTADASIPWPHSDTVTAIAPPLTRGTSTGFTTTFDAVDGQIDMTLSDVPVFLTDRP
ncbi:MAG: hypothetical protein IH988_00190 [Planctomycetes bacterium]|nr:hypothetical protein [Planctomycetota bacterium]